MDLFPKFIIEGDKLVLSKCTFHHQLVINKELVKGGGWFRFKSEDYSFTFHGDSHDFGKASTEDIKACIENDKVFTRKHSTHSIARKHKFFYDTGSEIIPLN